MGIDRRTRVKARLLQMGYTQSELADAIGYSRSRIAAVLNGARDGRNLLAVMESKLNQWEDETKCRQRK